MQRLRLTADELVLRLLWLAETEDVWLLDSCGVGHLNSHLLLAGIRPARTAKFPEHSRQTLVALDAAMSGELAAIFTLSYDYGAYLQGIPTRQDPGFPDASIAFFDSLIVHDYNTGETYSAGAEPSASALVQIIENAGSWQPRRILNEGRKEMTATSDMSRSEYLRKIETIQEHIRRGDTYQTNLTLQLRIPLDDAASPENVFSRLRQQHPAPFSSFIKNGEWAVVSASPERFFRIEGGHISTSPIKGTRRRDPDPETDARLRRELLKSEKDRAENTMIVDLLRNDLGRVCEYGSVRVEKLCDLEEHPTLFHLVSTISGDLRPDVRFSDVIRALFPCGSITGAPKIRTMQLIDEIEPSARGLSMGSIGISLPKGMLSDERIVDTNVAIRTMVIRNNVADFKVGGGIVTESDAEKEYDEALLKAAALLRALGAKPPLA